MSSIRKIAGNSDPTDPYDLRRFVEAQSLVYEQVRVELRSGQKTGHWIWFIFPQLRGLGYSAIAVKFGISSREEAVAYLKHPVLGARLQECTQLVISTEGHPIDKILGAIDEMKFRSSMTLFACATADNQIFKDAIQKYFGGELDPITVERLEQSAHKI